MKTTDWSARYIAKTLGQNAPTEEQVRVTEAPLKPMLVIAGAGSGKTETMAARVVYLVANRLVKPENILGLTFTRKAAGELSERIRQRLRTIAQADPAIDVANPPRISTYNAYASAIVGDHGLRVGVDPQSDLLTDAGRYQLAHHVVATWQGDLDVDLAHSTMASSVAALAGELNEHGVGVEQAQDFFNHTIDQIESKAPHGRSTQPRSEIRPYLQRMRNRVALLDLVEQFQRLKRDRGLLDFGDQVRVAAHVAQTFATVGAGERSTYQVVLLDEYQDTSIAQVELLAALFGEDTGHPVTAVGDPNQAIYGWRGAAAGTLGRFPSLFKSTDGPARVETLSTAWRNGEQILAVANNTAAPLRAQEHVDVPELTARPEAPIGEVNVFYGQTVEEEVHHIVDHLTALGWLEENPPSTAVLCRNRSLFPPISQALQRAGIPHQITGIGGLLSTPEVADVWAALQVVHDPSRSDCLMRLLTGPTMRIGPQDLAVLHAWAGKLARKRTRAQGADVLPEEDVEVASLVEAVQTLPPPEFQPPQGNNPLSREGRKRLIRLAQQLGTIRDQVHLPVGDVVITAERALGVDINVLAHRWGHNPRKNLDAFISVATSFTSGVDDADLGGFLAWLEAAVDHERGLDVLEAEPQDDAVQLMTIHAAKGLEWEAVVVAGMNEGIFPSIKPRKDGIRRSSGWLGANDQLAYELRGDSDNLPSFDHEQALTHADMKVVNETFLQQEGHRRLQEERRLAYVAFTRAKTSLLLTGSFWRPQVASPATPSVFLTETTRVVEEIPRPPLAPDAQDNPLADAGEEVVWPTKTSTHPPESPHLTAGEMTPPTQQETQQWFDVADLLLAEREQQGKPQDVAIEYLSASNVVQAVKDPHGFMTNRRRPLPQPPSLHARQGTEFHAWVEQHFHTPTLMDWDVFSGADEDQQQADLQRLKDTFLASEWANQKPVGLEVEVETTIAGRRIRSRIDAVFFDGQNYHVVDWKTGRPPAQISRDYTSTVQLQVYRLAWARAQGISVDNVGASYYYVAHDMTIQAPNLGEEEIVDFVATNLNRLQANQG